MKHRKQAGGRYWRRREPTGAEGNYQGTTLAEFAKHFDAGKASAYNPIKAQIFQWRHPEAVANKAFSVLDLNPTNQKVGSSSPPGRTTFVFN